MSASNHWYRERPEAEEKLRGILHSRDVGAGPGNRPGLVYALELADGSAVPVYGPTAGEHLDSLVGRSVTLTGKLVDLSGEGFGVELWIDDAAHPPTATDANGT